jgi:hypothetical protein
LPKKLKGLQQTTDGLRRFRIRAASLHAVHRPLVEHLLSNIGCRRPNESNPTREVTSAALNITATAAACEASAQAISDGISTSNQSNTDSGIAKRNLQTGMDTGRSRLSGLRGELTQLLDPNDDRWYAFGFDKPSDPSTPAVPQHVMVTPGKRGHDLCRFR